MYLQEYHGYMYKGWAYSALAPRPIVVYCAYHGYMPLILLLSLHISLVKVQNLKSVLITQLNSIIISFRANLTAQRPITKLARVHRNTQK
jgi:hypothetical protein